jgi:hypothetical protein
MPAKTDRRLHWLFVAPVILLLAASGCCGPMACGPVGCGGPVLFGGRTCGDGCSGCGERYYDEWINHPPSCSDPCDGCGNFNGQTCHACRPIFSGFPSLWGYRCDPPPTGCDRVQCGCGAETYGDGCGAGCASCGGGHMSDPYHPVPLDPDMHFGSPVPSHPRQMSPSIVREVPSVKPYQPQRTRPIFRPRASVATGHAQGSPY